jgi:hypothetical protein
MKLSPALLASLLGMVACSAASTAPPPLQEGSAGGAGTITAGGGGASSGSGGGGSAGTGTGIQVGAGDPDVACGEVGRSIFVVSSENAFLSFDPKAATFSKIGTLSCPDLLGATPFSMAVARDGTAYVLYTSGNIFKVSTTDASCTPSGYPPNQKGWSLFGMGWVSNDTTSGTETLFVIDGATAGGLGYISGGGALTPIGQFDGGWAGRPGEVTGTGDGRLFAFFVDLSGSGSSTVAEIDKHSGHVLSSEPQSLPPINAWAFAHWGGSFYLFNGTNSDPSRVHKYTPGKGTTEIVSSAGYSIVGAGVSTCAPIVEPVD